MYYLNDKHEDYEYTLYVKVGDACPYFAGLRPMKSWREVKDTIKWIEKKHSKSYMGWYYIDNDFYDNPYPLLATSTYYKILRRKVNDWKDFKTKTKDNIIDIEPYLKML